MSFTVTKEVKELVSYPELGASGDAANLLI